MTPVKAKGEPTIDELEATAAQAAAQAAAARRIIEERQEAAWRRREAAIEEWDRRHLAEWDDAALAAEEAAARDAFVSAVDADPVLSAWVHYRAVRRRRMDLLGEMQSIVNRYGINRRLPNIGSGEEKIDAALQSTLDRLAAALAGDAQDARFAAREAAGDKAAGS